MHDVIVKQFAISSPDELVVTARPIIVGGWIVWPVKSAERSVFDSPLSIVEKTDVGVQPYLITTYVSISPKYRNIESYRISCLVIDFVRYFVTFSICS